MSSIVIAGDTSGSVTLQAPAVAGSTVLNLPSTSGTIQTSGAGYTANGVAYATSTSALSTGSALTFDGTKLAVLSSAATTLESIKSTSTTSQGTLFQLFNDVDSPLNFGVFGSVAGTFGILGASTPFISTNASTLNFLNTNAIGAIVFGTGSSATERMRLDATNGLQVGTPTGNSGANGIHAVGTILQGTSGLYQQQLSISSGQKIQSSVLGVGYSDLHLNSLGGNVLIGTTSSTGSASNTAVTISGAFQTASGSVSAPSSTATAVATLPNVNYGTWIVCIALSTGVAATWSSTYVLNTQGTSSNIGTLLAGSGSGLGISMSGLSLRVQQGSGATQTIYWSITRIF